MITVKYNDQLLKAARMIGKSPEEVIHEIDRLIVLFNVSDDDYAGEVLAMMIWEKGTSVQAVLGNMFAGEQKITRSVLANLMMLTIYLVGSDNPCPDCGWEKAERSEDHTWFCPHCGWSEMMFLSEQNED